MSEEAQPFTQEDIRRYISDKEEESAYLEFKRGDALLKNPKAKDEICKDVSAFANSDGGILIYGIEEKNHVAANIVPVNGNEFDKERLEQIINTGIKRKIDGLTIEPIRIDGKIEQTVYVVRIPRSTNAAHMSSDGYYYKRANFQVIRLEEYEVRDLYNRREQTFLVIVEPIIHGQELLGLNMIHSQMAARISEYNITVRFDIANRGNAIETLYKTEIQMPFGVFNSPNMADPFVKACVRTENGYSLYSFPNSSPLFQGEVATVGTAYIKLNKGNFAFLENRNIFIKLFYSNGIEEKVIDLLDFVKYKGRRLSLDDFPPS